jgi:hypothetical protein
MLTGHVLSYEVRQRRRAIAVRSAIGASSATIFQAVLRRSLLLGLAGAGIGLVLAGAVTRTADVVEPRVSIRSPRYERSKRTQKEQPRRAALFVPRNVGDKAPATRAS